MNPKTYLSKKNFCVLPWTGLYIQPDGEVRNCAIVKEAIGNINDNSINDIVLGKINQDIKEEMLSDSFPKQCSHCHTLEQMQPNSLSQVSNRVWYLKALRNTDLELFDDAKNYNLKQLDLRWRNTCNFACVYCGPDLSSAWASEVNEPQHIDETALKNSIEYIYNNLSTVEHVYLAGGEPLLIKENLELLTRILKINPDIELRINSNLSIINNNIYNLLKQFKNVQWTISVDSVGAEFEYTRYGGNWQVFLDNLVQLSKDFEKINFNLVWFILNASSILDCIDQLQQLGYHENMFVVNPLNSPLEWHVCNLPESELDIIRDKLEKKLRESDPAYSLYKSLKLMLNYINTPFAKDINKTFNALTGLDNRRNLDSSKIFTDLYKLKGN
jgi:radical SAM protein with 4Fe4S-binding SPASM domain